MKKAIILLTLILVFAFIAACGNEPESPAQEAPAATEVQETPVPAPEPEIEEVSMTQYIEEDVDELSDVKIIINNINRERIMNKEGSLVTDVGEAAFVREN